jgi:hypothetical protein
MLKETILFFRKMGGMVLSVSIKDYCNKRLEKWVACLFIVIERGYFIV